MEHTGPAHSRQVEFETVKGTVYIRTYCQPDFIASVDIGEGLGVFFYYHADRLKDMWLNISRMKDGNVTLAYTAEQIVVGHVVFCPPAPIERWSQANDDRIYELGALETSRKWRGIGVAKKLLQVACDEDSFEDRIVISTEYAWHWDYEGTGLNRITYRNLLLHLLQGVGFREFKTDEPNITMDPANMLTARIGSRVDPELYAKFEALLFQRKQPAIPRA